MTDISLDPNARVTIIDNVLQQLHDHYIFPEVAQQMALALRAKVESGAYADITAAPALCEQLTADLQAISRDKHLRLFYSPTPQPSEPGPPTPEQIEEYRTFAISRNFGFESVERLAGNIGYLDLRGFFPPAFGGETAVAAMALLAHTRALIIDLRQNDGGEPEMIALLTTYLFDDLTHLNSFYWRDGDRTQQFWTLPYVPGKRYINKPVYVLTSSQTFSGAEEFAYNLQNLKRATIIGEVTGGGAHPVGGYPINAHIHMLIPVGRAINPISQTNWEGVGVAPDIQAPAEQALNIAQRLALKAVLEGLGDHPAGPLEDLAHEARAALAALEEKTDDESQLA
jgi:retinol-binding protein 3